MRTLSETPLRALGDDATPPDDHFDCPNESR